MGGGPPSWRGSGWWPTVMEAAGCVQPIRSHVVPVPACLIGEVSWLLLVIGYVVGRLSIPQNRVHT